LGVRLATVFPHARTRQSFFGHKRMFEFQMIV
jgi:hypothetical protein